MTALDSAGATSFELSGEPLRVLIVDDNPDDRALVRRALRRDYANLVLAEPTNAPTFEASLREGQFDLVITDYQLRWTTGLEILRAVKTQWPDVPVVMYTATGNEEIAVEAMKNGLAEYVLKHRVERLPTSIELALRQARQQKALAEAQKAQAELLKREQSARAEAEAALHLRDQFLSIAAHELKTPVTALRSVAQVTLRRIDAGREVAPERTRDALQTMQREAEHLGRLIDRLMDASRIADGEMQLERHRIDLVQAVERVVQLMQAATDRHTITVRASELVEGDIDPIALDEVLINLLDNALKFSPAGGEIDVIVQRIGDQAEVSVRDHGVGIAPEHRERVFDRFYMAHNTDHLSGLGIGLFLARQVVDMHGGRIWVEAPDDGGTRVVVRLPVQPV
jgi:signal transduction histidine kinase